MSEETPAPKAPRSRTREFRAQSSLFSSPEAPQVLRKPASGHRKVAKGVNGAERTHTRKRSPKDMTEEDRSKALREYEYILGGGVDSATGKRRIATGGRRKAGVTIKTPLSVLAAKWGVHKDWFKKQLYMEKKDKTFTTLKRKKGSGRPEKYYGVSDEQLEFLERLEVYAKRMHYRFSYDEASDELDIPRGTLHRLVKAHWTERYEKVKPILNDTTQNHSEQRLNWAKLHEKDTWEANRISKKF